MVTFFMSQCGQATRNTFCLTLPYSIDILPTSAISVDFVQSSLCFAAFVELQKGLPLQCGGALALLIFV